MQPVLQSVGGMTTTTLDIDDLLGPQDGRFVDGIFNYCDRWCERCPFTDRCRLYFDLRREDEEHPQRTLSQHVEASMTSVMTLLTAWCEQHGLDLEEVRREARSEAAGAAAQRRKGARADPLQKMAEGYSHAAYQLLQAMDQAAACDTLPEPVQDAIETIRTHLLLVSSKIYRALSGFADRDKPVDESPIQNDWNGSAKVARLVIDQSRIAWERLLEQGKAPADSPIRRMPQLLDAIDRQLAERFPRAMEFVRPGFDDA